MIKGVILDLDGTVYWGAKAVPGAVEFVDFLRRQGIPYLFVTNRANRPPEEIRDQLQGMGIVCAVANILTSSQATAQYLKKGTVYFIGEEGIRRALEEAGLKVTEEAPDYVVVSFDREFSYEKLTKACRFIGAGAKFVATNSDRALKTDKGLLPGTGALVAAVAAGSGVEPEVVGKPQGLIMDMALRRLGLRAEEVLAVGDSVHTDIPAGMRVGMPTALILTGVSTREDVQKTGCKPTWIVETFEELERILTAENG